MKQGQLACCKCSGTWHFVRCHFWCLQHDILMEPPLLQQKKKTSITKTILAPVLGFNTVVQGKACSTGTLPHEIQSHILTLD